MNYFAKQWNRSVLMDIVSGALRQGKKTRCGGPFEMSGVWLCFGGVDVPNGGEVGRWFLIDIGPGETRVVRGRNFGLLGQMNGKNIAPAGASGMLRA